MSASAIAVPQPAFRSFSANNYEAVTPSDSTVLTHFYGVYVGVTGDVALSNESGQSVVFKAVPVGAWALGGNKVLSTGTTATNIVALR